MSLPPGVVPISSLYVGLLPAAGDHWNGFVGSIPSALTVGYLKDGATTNETSLVAWNPLYWVVSRAHSLLPDGRPWTGYEVELVWPLSRRSLPPLVVPIVSR